MKTMTVMLLATLVMLTACETTEGLGRDMQKAGSNLSTAAEKHKP